MTKEQEQEWNRHVLLVASMSHDMLCGKGPTKQAFVLNLRLMSEAMGNLLTVSEPCIQSPPDGQPA